MRWIDETEDTQQSNTPKTRWRDEAVQTASPAKPQNSNRTSTTMAGFRQLEAKQAAEIKRKEKQVSPTVGENLFLHNVLPIKQDDSFVVKAGKGAVNAVVSAVDAPFEGMRHIAIGGSNALTGKSVWDVPKETSYYRDIIAPALPQKAVDKMDKLNHDHPVIGGAMQAVIDATDPAMYVGVGGIDKYNPLLTRPNKTGLIEGLPAPKQKAKSLTEELENMPAQRNFNPSSVPIKKGISGNTLDQKSDFIVDPAGRTVGESIIQDVQGNVTGINTAYPLAQIHGRDYTPNTSLGNRQRIYPANEIVKPEPSIKVGDTVYNQTGEPLQVVSVVNKNTIRVLDNSGNRSPVKIADVKTISPIPDKMETLPNGQKVRSTPVSMAQAKWTNPQTKEALISEMRPEGRGAYEPITLRQEDARAQDLINNDLEGAIRFVSDTKQPSALHTATGIRLVERLQNEGNHERAIDVAMSLAENLTKSGQAISAARLTSALQPDGVLIFAQRQINKINQERLLPGLTKDARLTEQDARNLKKMAEIMQNAEGAAKIEASQELQGALQALKPAGFLAKVDTTQTIGQLLNPKTIVRNTIGNELFYRLERINKYVSAPIDWTRSKLTGSERTVTFATGGQSGYWDGFFTGVKAGWKGVNPKGIQTQYDLGQGLRFNQSPNRAANAQTVLNKTSGTVLDAAERTMSFLERCLGATLKGFDFAAYNRAYNQTLGEMAVLRAKNSNMAVNKAVVQKYIKEADDNLKDIADQYGKYVTFQDNNVISQGLSTVKRGLNFKLDWGLGSMILKYPRTPGALIMRGIEYSPAGFLRSAYQLAKVKGIMRGEASEREVILSLSRAITGTAGLTGLGYFFADVGIITGSASNDKDLNALQKQVGQGAYTVNLTALKRWVKSGFNREAAQPLKGDKIVNYDWMQPTAMAFAMGANLQKSQAENQGFTESAANIISNSLTGLASGIDTIAEQPVLQGLEKLTSSYPNESTGGKIGRVLSETARDVPASFTPTLFNQIRSAADNQKRSTYDPNIMVEGLNKARAKIPFLAGNLPKAYDTLGNESKTYPSGNNNLFNVFLNPAFINTYNPSPEAQMVIDIYKNTGETEQVPRVIQKYFNVDGKRIQLTAEEYSQMQKQVGEATRKGFSNISPDLPDDEKIKAMVSVMTDAGIEAKTTILESRGISIPDTWTDGAGYLIHAINKGDVSKAAEYIMKSNNNNAFNIYEYGKNHGMVDNQGNIDPRLLNALSEVWNNQTVNQSKSAAFDFMFNACENGNQEEAVKWALIAKQYGITSAEANARIKQRAKLSATGSKTPSMKEILQGGYDVDPETVIRLQWAMGQ